MTEAEIFDSTDPLTNASDVYKYTAVANLYNALKVVALDIFEDRYEIFLLPLSFTSKSKKSLQVALRDFEYAYAQQNDRPFLVSVFNRYETAHGKIATIELLEWMRNTTDSTASGVAGNLTSLYFDIKRERRKIQIPPRIQRYFGVRELLRDQYGETMGSRELDPSWLESTWDIAFHAKHAHDYYGTIENSWDPGVWAFAFGSAIYGKVAWENACQGSKPEEAELKLIGDWIVEHSDHLSAKDYENPASLFVSPILRAEYVRRGLILD